MKNMKKIVAAILSLSMVGAIATTSFAAALDWTNDIDFIAKVSPATVKAGEDVTVSFYMKDATYGDAIELLGGGTYGFHFSIDEDIVTYKSHAVGQDYGTETFASKTVDGDLYYTNIIEPSATATVTADAPIFTYVFTVNEGVEAGTYDIITDAIDMYVGDMEGNCGSDVYNFDKTAAKVTVEEDGPIGPEVDKVEDETAAGITAYTVSTLAEKVIMTKTFQNVAVKPGMGLIVNKNGEIREFGGDLYAVLGSPAEGTVTIGSLTFGLVVENTASASQFTFELR